MITSYELLPSSILATLSLLGLVFLSKKCKASRKQWKLCIQSLWYFEAAVLILSNQLSLANLMSLGLLLCLSTIAVSYFRNTTKTSEGYTLAKEHLGFFSLIWFMQNIGLSYLSSHPSLMQDPSYEATLAFILYSIFVTLVCISQRMMNKKFSWKPSILRGWYYTLLLWILASYGVELLLLSAFVLVWIGMLFAYFKKEPLPIGCQLAKENVWLISFFWLIRSFLFQPFIVPTGSLEPTIFPGDFVLVKQYAYGLRFPVWGWNIFPVGTPERGDIAVFRFPPKPEVLYVKRVIGVPGDHITYTQDKLTINGVSVSTKLLKTETTIDYPHSVERHREELPGQPHDIFTSKDDPHRFRQWEWHVPKGQYLMLGDNRQGSNDSRFWGYVPESMLVGKVEYVLFSLDKNHLTSLKIRANRILRSVYASD